MPTRGIIGTDYLRIRKDFKVLRNPYGDDDVVVVPAISPDVAVIHCFRADSDGNVAGYGEQDNWMIAQASKKVIVTVEELVEPSQLRKTGQEVAIPARYVTAIVHLPGGAHPTGCPGYYGQDVAHIKRYIEQSHSEESFQTYLSEYVIGMEESEYQARVARLGRGGTV